MAQWVRALVSLPGCSFLLQSWAKKLSFLFGTKRSYFLAVTVLASFFSNPKHIFLRFKKDRETNYLVSKWPGWV